MNVASLVVSVLSVAAAAVALVLSQRSDIHARMPVLLSPRTSAVDRTLTIRNLGNGPALNVAVTMIDPALLDACDARDLKVRALKPLSGTASVHLQPLEAGETRTVEWAGEPPIAITYTDAFGRRYTTIAAQSGSKTFAGDLHLDVKLHALPFAPAVD